MASNLQKEPTPRAKHESPCRQRSARDYADIPTLRVGPSAQKNFDKTSAMCLSEELVKVIRIDEERKHQENKRMKQLEKDVEALQNEKATLQKEKQKLESKCQQTDELLETIQALKTENNKYKEDQKRKQDDVSNVTKQPSVDSSVPYDRDEMGKSPGEGNPSSIPDLSDPFRAVKVGEKYNELYDNEWTDALEILCTNESDEEGNVKKLMDILKNCYELCDDLSGKQMTVLEMVLLNPGASIIPMNRNYPKQNAGEGDNLVLSKSTQWHLNYCRKDMLLKTVDSIFKDHARTKLGLITEDIPNYVKGCIEVCWLMCTQDPPVYIGNEADVGSAFDCDVYKPYTISGTIVSYNVWPPLLLHKDGPLLVKGTVQPVKVPRAKKSTAEPKPKTPAKVDGLKDNYRGETYRLKGMQHKTTTTPREKSYSGSQARENYNEHPSDNASEDSSSPVHPAVHGSYGGGQDSYGSLTHRNHQQDVVSSPYDPVPYEYQGMTYVLVNGQLYTRREYQQIFGTIRRVSNI